MFASHPLVHTVRQAVFVLFLSLLGSIASAQQPDTKNMLVGHASPVNAAIYSANAKWIASASSDQTIKLWQAATHQEIRTLRGHTGQVLSLAMLPGGETFLSGAADNTIRQWDLPSTEPLHEWLPQKSRVRTIAIGPKGRLAYAAGDDHTIQLIDLLENKPSAVWSGHASPITRIAPRGDDLQVASSDAAGNLLLWNSLLGKSSQPIGAHVGEVTGLAYLPDNRIVTTGADGLLKVWKPTPAAIEPAVFAEGVSAVAVTSDGQTALYASNNKVHAVTVATGAELRVLEGSEGSITSLQVDAKNALVAAADNAGALQLWQLADGASAGKLLGHDGAISDFAMHPTEDFVATLGEDQTIRIWRKPPPPIPLAAHTAAVNVVVVSPNHAFAVTASADNKLRIMNPKTGALIRDLVGHENPVKAVAISSDSALIASGDDVGELKIWNAADGALQATIGAHNDAINTVEFHPSGKLLVTGAADGTIKKWPLPIARGGELPASTVAVTSLAASPKGATIAIAGADKSLKLLGPEPNQNRPLANTGNVVAATALMQKDAILLSGDTAGTLALWSTKSAAPYIGEPGAETPTEESQPTPPAILTGHVGAIHDIAVDEPTGRFATAGADAAVRIWRLPTAPRQWKPAAGKITAFVVSPDRTLSAAAGVQNDQPAVFLRDLKTGRVVRTLLGHGAPISAIAFSHSGEQIATGDTAGDCRIWNLADEKFPQASRVAFEQGVTAVAFSTDSETVYWATDDNAIHAHHTGEEVQTLAGHTKPISALVARKGLLVSASADGTVRKWNTDTGKAIATINHAAAISSLAVSADGAMIISAGADNNVKIWNAADNSAIATLAGHTSPVLSVSLESNGEMLASASAKELILWNVATGRPLQTFAADEWPMLAARFIKPLEESAEATGITTRQIAVAGADGAVRIYRPDLIQWFSSGDEAVTAIKFSADGESIYNASGLAVQQISLVDGKTTATFNGPTQPITSIALADGNELAAASEDSHVYFWQPAPPKTPGAALPPTFKQQFAFPIRSLQFNADASQLAIAGDTSQLVVWDTLDQHLLQRFSPPAESVTSSVWNNSEIIVGGSPTLLSRFAVAGEIVWKTDQGPIHDLAFTPDGLNLMAATDQPDIVRLPVDATLVFGEPAVVPTGGESNCRSLAVHAAGEELAVLLANGQTKRVLWKTGKLAADLPATEPTESVESMTNGQVAYDHTGALLGVASGNQIRIFDVATGRLREVLPQPSPATSLDIASADSVVVGHAGGENNSTILPLNMQRLWVAERATRLAITPDGAQIITAGSGVQRWNFADGALLETIDTGDSPATAIAIFADGKSFAVAAENKTVSFWPMQPTESQPRAATTSWNAPAVVRDICISADEQSMVTVGDEPVARLWNVSLGRQSQAFSLPQKTVPDVAMASGKIFVAGETMSRHVLPIDIESAFIAHESGVRDFALFTNNTQMATAGAEGGVRIWNVANGAMVREIETAAPIVSLTVRGDNLQLATAGADGFLEIFNVADGASLLRFKKAAAIEDLSYSADNNKLAVTMVDNRLQFLNPDDGKLLSELADEAGFSSATFTSDSKHLLTGNESGGVKRWRYASPESIRTITGHGGSVYAVTCNTAGTLIASASADQTVRIWNAQTGAAVRTLSGHVGAVYGVAFSPDGSMLASCGADKTIRLWDVAGGRQLRQIEVAEKSLYSVAFHADGKTVAAAGLGKKVYLYDVLAGSLVKTLEGHDDFIYRVAFNKTSSRLFSSGYGGTVIVWNVATGAKLFEKTEALVTNAAAWSPGNDHLLLSGGDGRVRFVDLPTTAR